jgi:hypothetical protein
MVRGTETSAIALSQQWREPLSFTESTFVPSPTKSASVDHYQKHDQPEPEQEFPDLADQLATETAVARSRFDENSVLTRRMAAASSELQEVLARNCAERDQRDTFQLEVTCAELPLLKNQLQATELEECAASERCTKAEVWLQGAAAEAREAVTVARHMAAAEATFLAKVIAAEKQRDSALEEMRQLRTTLRKAESDGGFSLYREEAGAAEFWRSRTKSAEEVAEVWCNKVESVEEVAEMWCSRAESIQAKSEAHVADLEARLRSMESRQAKARAAFAAFQPMSTENASDDADSPS